MLSCKSGFVIPPLRFSCLSDTPICVPSQASFSGLNLHQGYTCFLKSIFICAIQEKNHFMKVAGHMNEELRILFVLYFLVISLQNAVNEILDDLTELTKSQPISSPADVLLDRK